MLLDGMLGGVSPRASLTINTAAAGMERDGTIQRVSITSMATENMEKNHGIVGYHVGSQVFYTHEKTIKRVSFPTSEQRSYVDTNGITVFLLEGDPELFSYVHQYLTGREVHLPPFESNPTLWRNLRQEAELFRVDGLTEALQVTHNCPFEKELLGRGVLHWLSTQSDDLTSEVLLGEILSDGEFSPESPVYSRKLIQHQPLTNKVTEASLEELSTQASLKLLNPRKGVRPLWPGAKSLVIFLPNVQLKPTHISLRVAHNQLESEEARLGYLECSQDGIYWEQLLLEKMPPKHTRTVNEISGEVACHLIQSEQDCDENEEMLVHFAEKYLRRTWKVQRSSTKFYSYFRFRGVEQPYTSMAGCGLEFFGEIHQD